MGGSTLNEDCFQSNTLKFTGKNSTIHFDDGSHGDITLPTTTYVAPDGTQWRTNPIPGCACDNGLRCGGKDFLESKAAGEHAHSKYSQGNCAGQYPKSTVYPQHGSATPNCPQGTMFEAGFSEFTQGFLVGSGNKFSVMDEIQGQTSQASMFLDGGGIARRLTRSGILALILKSLMDQRQRLPQPLPQRLHHLLHLLLK